MNMIILPVSVFDLDYIPCLHIISCHFSCNHEDWSEENTEVGLVEIRSIVSLVVPE